MNTSTSSPAPPLAERAAGILRGAVDPGATFRRGQLEAIERIVKDGGRHLVVQATGWGKSTVYFAAARLLREDGRGSTLVVSPLIALIRDQLRQARERFVLRANAINSTNPDEHDAILGTWQDGQFDVLFITPERLAKSEEFDRILAVKGGIALMVIDEAHCISTWGHDFRPDFRRIVNFLGHLDSSVAVLCTTATANDRVVEDIKQQVGTVSELRGPLARQSLHLDVVQLPSHAERLAWLARNVPKLPGSGIVYVLTKRDADLVADWLRARGIAAASYHSGISDDDRIGIEMALLENRLKAVVATSALGMGFDKPDLGFVVHFQRPAGVVDYYQQIGRAGRAIPEARCIMLCGLEDPEIHKSLRESSFPAIPDLQKIVGVLERNDAMSLRNLQLATDIPRKRLQHALRHLEIDGAVSENYEDRWMYSRTANAWIPPVDRMAQVVSTRAAEWDRLQSVVSGDLCIAKGISEALNDSSGGQTCGQCSTCRDAAFAEEIPPKEVGEAQKFFREKPIIIEPRKQWMELDGRKPSIPATERCEEGRALSRYSDAGWGKLVTQGKYVVHHFQDDLVDASVDLIQKRWPKVHVATQVSYVPSRKAGAPISDFAKRLAHKLDLPFVNLLTRNDTGKAQKEFRTSEHQLDHARRAYSLAGAVPKDSRILLVDDLVDSRWTFTFAGYLLRSAGAAAVFPFALADGGTAA